MAMFDRCLPDLCGRRILDVGCGHGMMMAHLDKQGNDVRGIDIVARSLVHNAAQGLLVSAADARQIPFRDDTFDLVYSLGVIEHFTDTMGALQEKVRVCRPGGSVVAVVPNLLTPLCPAAIGFERLTRPGHDLLVTYGKAFTRRNLTRMLADAGCRNIRVEPYYGSAFIRALPVRMNHTLSDRIEQSWISRQFGLVLWGQGIKGGRQ